VCGRRGEARDGRRGVQWIEEQEGGISGGGKGGREGGREGKKEGGREGGTTTHPSLLIRRSRMALHVVDEELQGEKIGSVAQTETYVRGNGKRGETGVGSESLQQSHVAYRRRQTFTLPRFPPSLPPSLPPPLSSPRSSSLLLSLFRPAHVPDISITY
jgi:hypothetical protein